MKREEIIHIPMSNDAPGIDEADIPDWANDAIIYNIFPDSFATSRRNISKSGQEINYKGNITKSKNGGTIKGITENLDYLLKLGINCIYFNPLFVAGEYHKYNPIDYYHVDPCFGTDSEFKFLVDMCHNCNIKVIIDGIFYQCGQNFYAFQDVKEHGAESNYSRWFPDLKPDSKEDIPKDEYVNESLMPKPDTSNPEVTAYFCDVCRYWINEFDIDGWCLNAADEVSDDFRREFRRAAKQAKPDCFLIGGIRESAAHWLEEDQFDSSMNYNFRRNCEDFFAIGRIDAGEFDARITSLRMKYHKHLLYGQLNLFDCPEVPRFFSLCKESPERFKLAVLFQMTFIGTLSIFYGDEQLLSGLKETEYRSPMRWEDDNEEGMFAFYKAAIYLRKKLAALRRGDYHTLHADKESSLYVYERIHGKERIIVALNSGNKPENFSLDTEKNRIIWQSGYEYGELSGYGYIIAMQI